VTPEEPVPSKFKYVLIATLDEKLNPHIEGLKQDSKSNIVPLAAPFHTKLGASFDAAPGTTVSTNGPPISRRCVLAVTVIVELSLSAQDRGNKIIEPSGTELIAFCSPVVLSATPVVSIPEKLSIRYQYAVS
jgi:hypothetical protein